MYPLIKEWVILYLSGQSRKKRYQEIKSERKRAKEHRAYVAEQKKREQAKKELNKDLRKAKDEIFKGEDEFLEELRRQVRQEVSDKMQGDEYDSYIKSKGGRLPSYPSSTYNNTSSCSACVPVIYYDDQGRIIN